VIFASKNIRHLLKETNTTARELDKILGKVKGSVSGYSNHEDKAPPIEVTISLCQHFNLSIDDFLFKDLSKSENILDDNLNILEEDNKEYQKKETIKPVFEPTELEEKRWELAMKEIEALRMRVEMLEKEGKRKK
jgi:transcriptional regulator with XRE-family HTH domain